MGYRQIRIKSSLLSEEDRWRIYCSTQKWLCGAEGDSARRWLVEKRGLDVQTISDFRLGFMPEHIDHHFSGRVVMPVFDSASKLIALSVRPPTNDKAILDEYSKYWNEHYEKGWNLYGLNLAKLSIVQRRFVILVEGQFDVMVMHSYGFTNTVGVLGGAFTPMQAELLKKWTSQIILMFDGDKAGWKHAERCMETLSYYGWVPFQRFDKKSAGVFRTGQAKLRDDFDPADYLNRYGAYPMRQVINDAMKSANMNIDW